jgi:hypothetical protein
MEKKILKGLAFKMYPISLLNKCFVLFKKGAFEMCYGDFKSIVYLCQRIKYLENTINY